MKQNCSICAYTWQFLIVVCILLLISFAWNVVIPAFFTGNTDALRKKYNKSGKAWAIVTGTTSGIGSAFVSILARLGFNVLMVARNESKLKEMKASCSVLKNVKVDYIVIDLAKTGDLVSSELTQFLASHEVSILVNNAGMNTDYPKLFIDNSLTEVESIIDVNARALTVLTHTVLPSMVHRQNGLIINISSLFGQLSGPLVSVYSGTKNYIDGFSLSLSEEMRGTGVSVFCSLPGFVVSNMSKIKRTSFTVISPETCVTKILQQAAGGRLTIAAPHWTHAAIGWIFSVLVPQFIRLRILGHINRGTNKAALKKAERERLGKSCK